MPDGAGQVAWSADIGIYGELHNLVGDKHACPFRWPGQYEDDETGLYYNRFRYYDPDSGEYVRQDPIGLGGPLLDGYVADPSGWFDPLGLAGGAKAASWFRTAAFRKCATCWRPEELASQENEARPQTRSSPFSR